MITKFRQLSWVRVNNPEHRFNIDEDTFEAIICGSGLMLFGGDADAAKDYSLFVVRDGKIVDRVSWVHESNLTPLLLGSRDQAEQMVEDYQLTRGVKVEDTSSIVE